MALKERLAHAPGSSQGVAYGHRGKIDRWLDQLPADERTLVIAALQDQVGWTAARLAYELRAEGFDVSDQAIRLYRSRKSWERRADTLPAKQKAVR
jgi:hypothetical protein